jgi:hypothetical protein
MFALALMVFGIASFAVASNEPMHTSLQWRMTLDASGRITALSPVQSENAALKAKLEPVIRAWEFVPGAVNGQPAATDTILTVQLALLPIAESEQLSVVVEDVRTGGRIADASQVPRFPRSEVGKVMRAGGLASYFFEVSYDGKGIVQSVTPAAGSTKGMDRLRRSAEQTLSRWIYEPEQVAGIGVPGTLIVPVCYSVGSSRSEAERAGNHCVWTKPGSKATVGEGQSLALDSSVTLKTHVIGSML